MSGRCEAYVAIPQQVRVDIRTQTYIAKVDVRRRIGVSPHTNTRVLPESKGMAGLHDASGVELRATPRRHALLAVGSMVGCLPTDELDG